MKFWVRVLVDGLANACWPAWAMHHLACNILPFISGTSCHPRLAADYYKLCLIHMSPSLYRKAWKVTLEATFPGGLWRQSHHPACLLAWSRLGEIFRCPE
jgi:hypothetical protein